MSAAPLTHHEILTLVEPLARRGRQLDLEASGRLQRRLAFRAIVHVPVDAGDAPIRETLELESFASGSCRLTRTVERPGLKATLQSSGRDAGALLAGIEAVQPERQFRTVDGASITLSYDLEAGGTLLLTRSVVIVGPLRLTLSLTAVRGVAAELAVASTAPEALALPEDLFAVLGWDWARLEATREGWRSRLRLRGNPAQRSRRAEEQLSNLARHLALTLAETPGAFHDRLRASRWLVAFRRGIPLLTVIALMGAVAMLPSLVADPRPATLMLIFHVPTVLIALSFCLQEMSKFEIPPMPRRSPAPHWTAPSARTTR